MNEPIASPMPEPDDDLVLVGRIARPHGLRGDVIVDPQTDFAHERFAPGGELLRKRERGATTREAGAKAGATRGGRTGEALETLRIVSVKFHRDRPIVRFDGVESIEQADALGRVDLWIRAESRGVLPAGEFYHDALIGCRVETTAGAVVGDVTRIDGPRGMALLVIRRAGDSGGSEILIPLAEQIVPVIDTAARRIVIDPPAGLLELNG